MKKTVILSLFAFLTGALSAATETVNGITWNYIVSNRTAQIYKENYSAAIPTGTSGAITIPSTLGGYPVTSIREFAFSKCSGLTSVTIPDSVTSIGNMAFELCTGLTSVTIPDSVTVIKYRAFNGCNASLYDTVTIPGVKLVDGWVIGYTDSLSDSLEFTSTDIRGIGDGAFAECYRLHSVTIPNNVTNIGDFAFRNCNWLANVTMHNSVTRIGEKAFANCIRLTSVTIPDSVKRIEEDAFFGCSGLTTVTISQNICTNGLCYAFPSLCQTIANVIISKGVTTIGNSAFRDCGGLWKVTIPDSVTSIGDYAFSGCSRLADVTIPDSVTSIGDYAFSGCSWLADVAIPDSVTSIGNSAFSDCASLASVTIGDGVLEIGDSAFHNCSQLTAVNISDLTAWCRISFGNGDSNPASCAHNLYFNGNLITDLIIPDRLENITSYAFYKCSGLASVTIPESVTSIGYQAFFGCSGLTDMTIPDGVNNIARYAFAGCSNLTKVSIPDSMIVIWDRAFYDCSGLTSVTLPAGMRTLENGAFENCGSITNATISASYVGYGAFSGCTNLVDVTILDGVKTIGYYAFSDCSDLTNVTIPNSVTHIGNCAFWNCSGLKSLVMKGNCPSVSFSAFNGVADGCVVWLPRGDETYTVTDGKWQGMTVEWYGAEVTVNGAEVSFADSGDGKTRTAAVAEGTTAEDIRILVGGVDVTKGFSRKVEGTTATVALLNPCEVPKVEGATDAPWTEDGEGNVTLNITVVPGLYYAAASAASLDALKCPGADSPATVGTTLTVAKPDGGTQGFFKVWVGDSAMAAEH